MVAAITGAPSPYVVGWKAPSTADTSCGAASCPWPVIQHACTAADASFADPAVRINELVQQFGANGTTLSICDADFSPALSNIASEIVEYVNAPCIQGRIAKRPGTTREDCTVTDNATGGSVPACADTGATARVLAAGRRRDRLWWRRLRLGAGKRFPGHHRGLRHVRPRHARPGARLPVISDIRRCPVGPAQTSLRAGPTLLAIRHCQPPVIPGGFLARRLPMSDDGPKNPARTRQDCSPRTLSL